jgi:ribosome-associated translation inhibitor RaiA
MARIVISNTAEDCWQQVIESKLQIMLGSMLGQVGRVDIALDKSFDKRLGQTIYSCTLMVRESGGQKHMLHNHQADANLAIEGALARARRTLTRLSRSRPASWGQTSSQKQFASGVLYNLHD